jgi:hypothetical protein
MPIYQRLTDRQFSPSAVTLNDLIHIVVTGDTSQSPEGSSFKVTLQDVFNSNSGSTNAAVIVSGTGVNSSVRKNVGNIALGNNSGALGGLSNSVTTNYSMVVGGQQNIINSGTHSFIGGGSGNTISARYSTIGGGYCNKTCGSYSVIVGGKCN